MQNADDALIGAATTEDRVLFRLTNHELWMANTGRAFTAEDVRGLCGLGASSKAHATGRKRVSIGHKGLGFKSVLEITASPEAYSQSVSFVLGRENARPGVEALWTELGYRDVRDVPAMRFPSAADEAQPVWTVLRNQAYHAAFRFPLIDRVDQRPGISVWQNNGVDAHQAIPHLHFHIAGTAEGGGTEWDEVHGISLEETDAIAERLRPHL